ncbi:hypothetical protein KAM346_44970 [Aeromonas caviae]|nr:hypothetical protein KAM346_44970 [Aeromonas caviae]
MNVNSDSGMLNTVSGKEGRSVQVVSIHQDGVDGISSAGMG